MRGLPPRAMDISVKPAHWLRRTITIDTTEHNVLDLSIYLDNGDVEDDNEVNLADYSALATAFGSAAGDENWNPMSDLNGDDEISLADCSILARNFGLAGND